LYSAVAPPPSVAEAVADIVERVVGVVSYSKAVWFSIIDTPRGKNVASKIKKTSHTSYTYYIYGHNLPQDCDKKQGPAGWQSLAFPI
jgi:hypothetical protein